MSKIIENKFLRLELGNDGTLRSFRNLATGTEFASPHGLWRLVCSCGDNQEIELAAERSTARIATAPRKFKIEYRDPAGPDGEKLSVVVTILGQLVNDELHMMITVFNDMAKDNIVRECHFPVFSLAPGAAEMALHTSEEGGRVWPCLAAARESFRNHGAEYQGPDYIYERRIARYPGRGASLNCFELNSGSEGLYFGNHDESFQTTCHIIEHEKPDRINLAMAKFPFLGAGNQASFENFIISAHAGSWHKGAEKYRSWAEKWFKFHPVPPAVESMKGRQRIVMRSQFGETFHPFNTMGKIRDEGLNAGLDTLLACGWHAGGDDNDYPNYCVSPALGGKEELKKGIALFHEKGGKVILYANGLLIDHNSDFYRYGNGKAVSSKDLTGNEHILRRSFSGRGIFNAAFGGRSFSKACPASREFFGMLKKYIDLAADTGADGVFFDQLGEGDELCCDSGHGHAVPFTAVMEARGAMLAKLKNCAESKGLSIGIGGLSDVTAQHADYIRPCSDNAEAVDPDWLKKGEKPLVPKDFSFFRYIFPEIIISNREIRDERDLIRRCNYMLVQNLVPDAAIYRGQRSVGALPACQEHLEKINAFREKHASLLKGARFRSDALHTCDTESLYSAGHLAPDGSLVVMATLSHLDKCKARIQAPGCVFDAADFLGEGKIDKKGYVELGRFSVVLLRFTRTKTE